MVKMFCLYLLLIHSTFINAFTVDNLHKNLFSESDFDLVYLPIILPNREALGTSESSESVNLEFTTFGRPISLTLKPNPNIVAPNFKTYINDGFSSETLNNPVENCYYLHRDDYTIAALSLCEEKSINGFIFLDNTTFEIRPVEASYQHVLNEKEALLEDTLFSTEDFSDKMLHVIKRASFLPSIIQDTYFTNENVFLQNQQDELNNFLFKDKQPAFESVTATKSNSGLTLEVAIFFDAAAYKLFSPYLQYDDKKIRDMILAYMNGVQALYHHSSLGTALEIVIVRLDIMKTQPQNMPHYDGERSKLLDSFCEYQHKLNPVGDSNPEHWDMALYVSGLDFYAIENGRKSGVTMGLATVGGVCYDKYACVIAELGTTNVFNKPYPSAGFTSVYILAHEIGHNLGMHHDSSGNNCPKEGYVMSPSRGTNGETQWSTCSADVMRKLSWAKCLTDTPKQPSTSMDHSVFQDTPGQKYGSKKQCEILLRDKDALMAPSQQLNTICYNLQCKTPHRSGYYFAGPALEGTSCGNQLWCQGGNCIKMTKQKPVQVIPGGWSDWKVEKCTSGCIEKSMGYQSRRRICNNPVPVNTDKGCEGSAIDTILCKDTQVCGRKKRFSVVEHASEKCKEFAQRLPELDKEGAGLQAPHEEARPWMGCSIFCRRADSGSYYTPRFELNDLGVSPYFPDGTWCHGDSTGQYFCLHHHCLPEGFKFMKNSVLHGIGEDIPISQNANPFMKIPPGLLEYLSLGPDGKPLKTKLHPSDKKPTSEEDWETQDYVELPAEKENEIPEESKELSIFDMI